MAKKLEVIEGGHQEQVTYIEFVRENGVQIVQPNGDFLRHARKAQPGLNTGNKSDFHIIGIKNVEVLPYELVITLESGQKRYFPKQSIASYTIE